MPHTKKGPDNGSNRDLRRLWCEARSAGTSLRSRYSQIISARAWQGLGAGWATEPYNLFECTAKSVLASFHDSIVDRIETCVIGNVTRPH